MLKFKGKVLNVDDRQIQFRAKDKDGNRTGDLETHRSISIQMLITSADGQMFACVVNKFDPDANFKIPLSGKDWETPEVQRYEIQNGLPNIRV